MKLWRCETCFIRRTWERVLKPQQQQQHKIEEKSYFQRGQFSLYLLSATTNKVYARSRLNCGWMIWEEINERRRRRSIFLVCMYCGHRATIYNMYLIHASMNRAEENLMHGIQNEIFTGCKSWVEKKMFIKIIMDILIAPPHKPPSLLSKFFI